MSPCGSRSGGARVLYLTYDGISDPLGQSQVLPYLEGLSGSGHDIDIISFEKPARLAVAGESLRRRVEASRIRWHPLRYTKRPPIVSTLWDVWRLERTVGALHRRRHFDLVHCRSYVTAIAGLRLKRRDGVKFLFDMRGFWPDEKVEGGSWDLRRPAFRAVYRYFKSKERQFLMEADGIVSLTEAARSEIHDWPAYRHASPPVVVIPCAADFDLFQPATDAAKSAARAELKIPEEALVVTYLGSLGTWYMLEEMLDWYATLRRSQRCTRFLFITPDDASSIRKQAESRSIDGDEVVVVRGERSRVPTLLSASDLGIFFIRPTFSKTASSPTKLGELLAMGLPIVTNSGVGDVDRVLADCGAGIVVSGFDPIAYERSVQELLAFLRSSPSELRDRARATFDLERGVASYDQLYRRLLHSREGVVTDCTPAPE